jgi:hypothetical protein
MASASPAGAAAAGAGSGPALSPFDQLFMHYLNRQLDDYIQGHKAAQPQQQHG